MPRGTAVLTVQTIRFLASHQLVWLMDGLLFFACLAFHVEFGRSSKVFTKNMPRILSNIRSVVTKLEESESADIRDKAALVEYEISRARK